MLLSTFLYLSLDTCGKILGSSYLEAELLNRKMCKYSTLQNNAKLFQNDCASFCPNPWCVSDPIHLHTLQYLVVLHLIIFASGMGKSNISFMVLICVSLTLES